MQNSNHGGSHGSGSRSDSSIYESVALVRRVNKAVSGGTKLSMSALVIVGDCQGKFGYGMAKDRDVSGARMKASHKARRNMIRVGLKEGRTIHYPLFGSCGASKVAVSPAPAGSGIIAGGVLRTVFELLGVRDVVARCLGSRGPHCVVAAVYKALSESEGPKQILHRRSMKREDLLLRRSAFIKRRRKDSVVSN